MQGFAVLVDSRKNVGDLGGESSTVIGGRLGRAFRLLSLDPDTPPPIPRDLLESVRYGNWSTYLAENTWLKYENTPLTGWGR